MVKSIWALRLVTENLLPRYSVTQEMAISNLVFYLKTAKKPFCRTQKENHD